MSRGRRKREVEWPTPEVAAPDRPTGLARRWLTRRSWNELTTAWRISTTMLAGESDLDRHLVLVILRSGILDEMEARDPRRFSAWLQEQQESPGPASRCP